MSKSRLRYPELASQCLVKLSDITERGKFKNKETTSKLAST